MGASAIQSIDRARYLTLDDLRPRLELAGCYDRRDDRSPRYRVPGAHFLFIAQGSIQGRSPAGVVEGRTGDLLCFPSADLNQYCVRAPTRFYEAHILLAPPPLDRHRLWLEGIGPLPLRIPLGGDADRMRGVFDSFCLELSQSGPVHRARVVASVWEMLSIVAEVARPSLAGVRARRLDPWDRARLRLGSDLGRELPLRELADELGLTVDHFIKSFRARFGDSPAQYRTQQKLRDAAHRLRSADEPIKSIARALGFGDAYSFTRAFRRCFGVLPSDLRSGTAALPAAVSPERPLIPINQHVLPPEAGLGYRTRFAIRK